MRIVRTAGLAALGFSVAISVVVGAPAWATANTYVFTTNYNVSGQTNNSTITATGGSLGFNGTFSSSTSSSVNAGNAAALTATVTAWNANPLTANASSAAASNYTISQAQLGMWQGGLGVISGYDNYNNCGTGDCGMHQIDGVGNSTGSKSYDFVQITFNKAVTLSAISRVAYGQVLTSSNTVYDDDFSFGNGSTAAQMKSLTASASNTLGSSANNTTMTGATFTGMLDSSVNNAGGCTVQSYGVCFDQNTSTMNGVTADQWHGSTTWWISASLLNPDKISDAFKLYDFTVIYNDAPITVASVPEPASWTMMIGGFGLIGGALRRKKAAERLVAA